MSTRPAGSRAFDLDALMVKVAAARATTPRGRQVPLLDLDALIEQTRAASQVSRGSGLPILYFASGSQHPGEIRGFAEIGHPLGVSAPECAANCERELLALAGTGVPIFIDSGAVAEVRIDKRTGAAETVEPISDAAWKKRLAFYLRLATALGAQLWAVAPDKIVDQEETLARWRRYRDEVRRVQAAGANLLVPLQHGRRSLAQMHAEADRIFAKGWIPAIPAREGATPLPAIRAYAAKVAPPRVHLLGISPSSPRLPEMLDALRAARPDMAISMDSVLLRAHVGEGRKYTRAVGEAEEELAEYRWGDAPERAKTPEGWGIQDYTTYIAFPSEWMERAGLEALAAEVGLRGKERTAFLADPDEWVQTMWDDDGPEGWIPALMEEALDKAWVVFRRKQEVAERKRRAVVRAFGPR